MSLDLIKKLYHHNGILFWKETWHNKCQKDSPAGTTKQTGYIEIQYKKKRYYAHRLIWEMFNEIIPDKFVIDHLDGNPSNNLLENLRCVDHATNLHGTRKLTRNTSGYIGVSWNKLTKSWEASVVYKGKRILQEYFTCIYEAALRVKEVKEKL